MLDSREEQVYEEKKYNIHYLIFANELGIDFTSNEGSVDDLRPGAEKTEQAKKYNHNCRKITGNCKQVKVVSTRNAIKIHHLAHV